MSSRIISEVPKVPAYAENNGTTKSHCKVTPITSTGTHIATVVEDGVTKELFAPSGSGGGGITEDWIFEKIGAGGGVEETTTKKVGQGDETNQKPLPGDRITIGSDGRTVNAVDQRPIAGNLVIIDGDYNRRVNVDISHLTEDGPIGIENLGTPSVKLVNINTGGGIMIPRWEKKVVSGLVILQKEGWEWFSIGGMEKDSKLTITSSTADPVTGLCPSYESDTTFTVDFQYFMFSLYDITIPYKQNVEDVDVYISLSDSINDALLHYTRSSSISGLLINSANDVILIPTNLNNGPQPMQVLDRNCPFKLGLHFTDTVQGIATEPLKVNLAVIPVY